MCVRRAKAALPAYHAQVAGAYSRRRISQGKALSQLEASPEFQNQQAEAKNALEQARAQAAPLLGPDQIPPFSFLTLRKGTTRQLFPFLELTFISRSVACQ